MPRATTSDSVHEVVFKHLRENTHKSVPPRHTSAPSEVGCDNRRHAVCPSPRFPSNKQTKKTNRARELYHAHRLEVRLADVVQVTHFVLEVVRRASIDHKQSLVHAIGGTNKRSLFAGVLFPRKSSTHSSQSNLDPDEQKLNESLPEERLTRFNRGERSYSTSHNMQAHPHVPTFVVAATTTLN